MNRVCILLDLDQTGLKESWQDHVVKMSTPMRFQYTDLDGLETAFLSDDIAVLVVFSAEVNPNLIKALELYKRQVGAIGSFQAIVSDDPSPNLMTEAYEFGIETFFSFDSWHLDVAELCSEVEATLEDRDSTEALAMELNRSILKGDQKKISKAQDAFGDRDSYDYLSAYSKGTAFQALGRFQEAVAAFENSESLNKRFRPTKTSLGENLMVLGQTDRAIEIFESLEKVNRSSLSRKVSLATAWLEKGDMEKARRFLSEAEAIDSKHPRVLEANAQMLLLTGKIGEAFELMDQLQDVGPFFAAKLNELGIRLSQKGKGKNALALYKKAHKVVRSELKYKISLNAALACYRMHEFTMALKYLNRCESEFGESFEKIDKIRSAIDTAIAKTSNQKAAG